MEGALEEVQKLLEKALGVHMDGGWTVFVRQSLEDALEVVSELRGQLKERDRYDKEIVQPELERLAELEELGERGVLRITNKNGNVVYYQLAQCVEEVSRNVQFS